jgi:hypothetical protein
MQVVIEKLSLSDIGFQLDSQYDPKVSDQEVFTENPLVNELIPPELYSIPITPAFPFELLLFAGGAVAVVAVAGGVIYYWRKRRYG